MDPRSGDVRIRQVFDLASDPRETRSLGSDFGDAGAVLERAAGDHGLAYPALLEPPDPELLRKLQALGYLGAERKDEEDDLGDE